MSTKDFIFYKLSTFIHDKLGLCDEYTQIKEVDTAICMLDMSTVVWASIFITYGIYFLYLESKYTYEQHIHKE